MVDSRLSDVLRAVVTRSGGPRAEVVALDARPLRGGISAAEVISARAEYLDEGGRRRVLSLVVKRLVGSARREIAVYRRLRRHAFPFAPRVLATNRSADATLLVLEWARASERWPWRRLVCAEAVIHAAAELHAAAIAGDTTWNYERELAVTAEATLDRVEAARRGNASPIDAASLRALRRVVGALGAIRREVVRGGPFAPTFIHGDLHPGNVVTARGSGAGPVLLDWGRARMGSPFEDVASWLQTLACWEPEARARHDSLLAAYLRARGVGAILRPAVRRAVWRVQAPRSELTVALATGPTKLLVRLLLVAGPCFRVVAPDVVHASSVHVAAEDLPHVGAGTRLQAERRLDGRRGLDRRVSVHPLMRMPAGEPFAVVWPWRASTMRVG